MDRREQDTKQARCELAGLRRPRRPLGDVARDALTVPNLSINGKSSMSRTSAGARTDQLLPGLVSRLNIDALGPDVDDDVEVDVPGPSVVRRGYLDKTGGRVRGPEYLAIVELAESFMQDVQGLLEIVLIVDSVAIDPSHIENRVRHRLQLAQDPRAVFLLDPLGTRRTRTAPA